MAALPMDPVLSCLEIEGRKLSQGISTGGSIVLSVTLDDEELQTSSHPQGELGGFRIFFPLPRPTSIGRWYGNMAPTPRGDAFYWAYHLVGDCGAYTQSPAEDLWHCRVLSITSPWERSLIAPYYRSKRSWRVVSILEHRRSGLVRGCILHHPEDVCFPAAGGSDTGLLLGELECAFALLGRQRATADNQMPGRVRIASITDTAVRVLDVTLDEAADPFAISFRVLKTVSLDDIEEDMWLQVMFLTTHEVLGGGRGLGE